MVGTAVYQVGRASFIQPKNLSASKPGAHQIEAPALSDADHGRDQAVNVEQRHDVETAVGRGQRQSRSDVPGGCHEV